MPSISDDAKVWFLVALVVGPMLALFLPHNIGIIVVGGYLVACVMLVFIGAPERPRKFG